MDGRAAVRFGMVLGKPKMNLVRILKFIVGCPRSVMGLQVEF
jgi:hypothetical protein